MSQVTYVAAGTRSVSVGGTVAPGIPAGLVTGDLMLCIGIVAAPARTYTGPAGWSTTQYFTNTSTKGPRLWCSWKAFAGDSGTATFTAGGTFVTGSGAFGKIYAFRNNDTTNGPTFGTAYTSGATTGTSVGPITGTAVSGLGMALAFAGWSSDYTTAPSTPSGWTSIDTQSMSTATVNVSLGLFYQNTNAAASPSVTVTGTPTTAATREGIQIALNEAAFNDLKLGSGNVLLKVGGSPATKAYIGSNQIWP